jgi:hypothetical protein
MRKEMSVLGLDMAKRVFHAVGILDELFALLSAVQDGEVSAAEAIEGSVANFAQEVMKGQ